MDCRRKKLHIILNVYVFMFTKLDFVTDENVNVAIATLSIANFNGLW